MLTAEGCRQRRCRLWQELDPKPDSDYLLLGDPIHLMYLASFWVDPISLGSGFRGYLIVRRDGHAKLIHENRLPASVEDAHVEERRVVEWYDGQSPAAGPGSLRRSIPSIRRRRAAGSRSHRRSLRAAVIAAIARMRRRKDADEIDLLRRCMRATEAGHAWARENLAPGMSGARRLQRRLRRLHACRRVSGHCLWGFRGVARSRAARRTTHEAGARSGGDLFILDFSVVIAGYRSDFTNTLAVGRQPYAGAAAEHGSVQGGDGGRRAAASRGAACLDVFGAVDGTFVRAGMAEHFGHHAGHGIGLSHPEAPSSSATPTRRSSPATSSPSSPAATSPTSAACASSTITSSRMRASNGSAITSSIWFGASLASGSLASRRVCPVDRTASLGGLIRRMKPAARFPRLAHGPGAAVKVTVPVVANDPEFARIAGRCRRVRRGEDRHRADAVVEPVAGAAAGALALFSRFTEVTPVRVIDDQAVPCRS